MVKVVPDLPGGGPSDVSEVDEAAALEAWLEEGWRRGWCSPPMCYSCDGVPTSETEDDDVERYGETCIHVVRLFESQLQRKQVLRQGGPVVWRASNRGWV